jgi:hypothetical protein
LTLVYSQQSSSDNSTKAQQLLRQKIAELNNPASTPAPAPAGSLSPEARAKAQKLLEEKLHPSNNDQKPAAPAPNAEAQAKAAQALQQKMNDLRAGTSSRPETTADAQQILRQKITELNSTPQPVATRPASPKPVVKAKPAPQPKPVEPQKAVAVKPKPPEPQKAATIQPKPVEPQKAVAVKPKPLEPQKAATVQAKPAEAKKPTVVQAQPAPIASKPARQKTIDVKTAEKIDTVPSAVAAPLTPELDAKAREVLRMKIAESRAQAPAQLEQPAPATQATAQAVLNQNEAELKAGVTPDTTEQTRMLRLKIAESRGIITHEEAARAAAAPAITEAATSSGPVAAAPRATSAIGASPVALQSSNKVGLARLNELTTLYKADRITPSEYHHERAKIVASL